MSLGLRIGIIFLLALSFSSLSGLGTAVGGFQRVKVSGVVRDPRTSQPVVLLADTKGKRAMPIWIGEAEAMALEAALEGTVSRRPLTHDLLVSVIEHLKATVEEVRVTELKEDVYYAVILMKTRDERLQVDSRPSDAMVIAVKLGKPISVESSLFEARSLPIPAASTEAYGLEVQPLDQDLKAALGYRGDGLIVSNVEKGGLAEKAGLRRGDIVVRIRGKGVKDPAELEEALPAPPEGLVLQLWRKGEVVTITLPPQPK